HIAVAQSYPTRPVNLVVFVPAGATPDIVARFAAAGASAGAAGSHPRPCPLTESGYELESSQRGISAGPIVNSAPASTAAIAPSQYSMNGTARLTRKCWSSCSSCSVLKFGGAGGGLPQSSAPASLMFESFEPSARHLPIVPARFPLLTATMK